MVSCGRIWFQINHAIQYLAPSYNNLRSLHTASQVHIYWLRTTCLVKSTVESEAWTDSLCVFRNNLYMRVYTSCTYHTCVVRLQHAIKQRVWACCVDVCATRAFTLHVYFSMHICAWMSPMCLCTTHVCALHKHRARATSVHYVCGIRMHTK